MTESNLDGIGRLLCALACNYSLVISSVLDLIQLILEYISFV